MSSYPAMMLNRSNTSPSSPRRKKMTPPNLSNLTISVNAKCSSPASPSRCRAFTLPSIATTSSSPGPSTKISMQFPTPPSSPKNDCRSQLTLPNLTSAIATPSNLCVSSNDREQPVARPMCSKRKLGPGCGLLDWIRLCRSTQKNRPCTEPMPVTLEELAKHNTEEDAWTAVRGKVYNMTQYIRFHPGGKEELMKGAGIDCTIIFDEVHKWVNVEKTLKPFYVGPLVASSPNTQRRKTSLILKNGERLRKQAITNSLGVPKTIMITDGMNKQVVRKNSMELRNETQAATACEEPDGLRQISPESPIRPIVSEMVPRTSSIMSSEAAESPSLRLSLPPMRVRRTSEPHPRFDWVQSEKAVIIHVVTQKMTVKTSDVTLDVIGKLFEAAIFVGDWVFELNIALQHEVIASQVNISSGRVEISLKKKDPSIQWEKIGTFLSGHAQLSTKNRRGVKYHKTQVESVSSITHDTKLYTLRLPPASYLNVPTGHHLSVKAIINGEEVERKYTPVSALIGNTPPRHSQPAYPQDGETVDLMVKLYKNGKMSGFLSSLKEGDEVMVSDPEGSFEAINKLSPATDILLIAAGSGLTPMVKILKDFMSTELVSRQRYISTSEAKGEASQEDQQAPELPPATSSTRNSLEFIPNGLPKTAKLLFANKKEEDIMWRQELDALIHATAKRFSVTHVLSEANGEWTGVKGRINETLLRTYLPDVNPQNNQNSLVCVCGPEPFTAAISNMLLDMEFPDECINIFQ